MDRWFLVYCKAQQEMRAEENLARQGFKVFRPTVSIDSNKIGRRKKVKNEALFPRYLFLNADPEVTSISPVSSTYGVANFVKFGDRYATASQSLIDEIKSNVDRQIRVQEAKNLKSGDEIYVNGHGFNHVKAIYCNPCGDERAMILMHILGEQSKLWVPVSCLSKA